MVHEAKPLPDLGRRNLSLGIPAGISRVAAWRVRIAINDGRRTENFSARETSVSG